MWRFYPRRVALTTDPGRSVTGRPLAQWEIERGVLNLTSSQSVRLPVSSRAPTCSLWWRKRVWRWGRWPPSRWARRPHTHTQARARAHTHTHFIITHVWLITSVLYSMLFLNKRTLLHVLTTVESDYVCSEKAVKLLFDRWNYVLLLYFVAKGWIMYSEPVIIVIIIRRTLRGH